MRSYAFSAQFVSIYFPVLTCLVAKVMKKALEGIRLILGIRRKGEDGARSGSGAVRRRSLRCSIGSSDRCGRGRGCRRGCGSRGDGGCRPCGRVGDSDGWTGGLRPRLNNDDSPMGHRSRRCRCGWSWRGVRGRDIYDWNTSVVVGAMEIVHDTIETPHVVSELYHVRPEKKKNWKRDDFFFDSTDVFGRIRGPFSVLDFFFKGKNEGPVWIPGPLMVIA